ncbi:TetR-like C-terminal domain-containing protein [Vagococcus sp.]|uniref:TetR-like C-terminal domain-containing protein n=1 Tax=Vagococcus sp. TaxID=1933889 RepID=UPI003F9AFE4B
MEQYAYFYSLGTTGIIKGWILDGCQRSVDDISDFLITIIQVYFYQETQKSSLG